MNFFRMVVFVFLGVPFAVSMATSAATVTVGPHGKYPSPCVAFQHLTNGDTVEVDANHGAPYYEGNCIIPKSNLKIVGVNGRPILDGTKTAVRRGIWLVDGHDIVIDNFEFRNAKPSINPGSSGNAAALWIRNGTHEAPNGGNITVSHCYIHDNGDGILSSNAEQPNVKTAGHEKIRHEWFSKHPYITFDHDDFYHNGDGTGQTHNIYIGYGGNMKFTLKDSISRDAYIGHDVKTRAPYNDILNNQISDQAGATSYLLDFPLGGTTNVVGNLLYRVTLTNPNGNVDLMIYRDVRDNTATDPVYGPPNEDLHFLHNVVIDNNPSQSDAYVNISCRNPSSETCAVPTAGPRLKTAAVVEGNLFVGLPRHATNQPGAVVKDNVVLPYSTKEAAWINTALQSISHPKP